MGIRALLGLKGERSDEARNAIEVNRSLFTPYLSHTKMGNKKVAHKIEN